MSSVARAAGSRPCRQRVSQKMCNRCVYDIRILFYSPPICNSAADLFSERHDLGDSYILLFHSFINQQHSNTGTVDAALTTRTVNRTILNVTGIYTIPLGPEKLSRGPGGPCTSQGPLHFSSVNLSSSIT